MHTIRLTFVVLAALFATLAGAAQDSQNYPQAPARTRHSLTAAEVAAGHTSGILNGHKWVDLGLPSGTKWADTNVGAERPEETGDFFAWGESRAKRDYSCLNCWTHTARIGDICEDATYDTARRLWGKPWRLPQPAEICELVENCDFEWVEIGGAQCARLVSRINGNSIVLPACGFKMDKDHWGMNSYADYWSSCPHEYGVSSAYTLMICEGGADLSNVYRYTGRPVRAVTD